MPETPAPTPVSAIAALIVAAGRGTRFGGDIPKQFQLLDGVPVLARTVAALARHPAISQLVVVHHRDDIAQVNACLPSLSTPLHLIEGGETRAASVAAGLGAINPEISHVLIHDAARPLVSDPVIDAVIAALHHHDGAAPGLTVSDALWRGETQVDAIHPRAGLSRAQTPQGFDLAAIKAAHAAHPGGAADDVEVALAHGLTVAITQGDEDNLKLTTPQDMARATRLLRPERPPMLDIRTGNGFDVHRFGPGDHLWLAGVKIPHERALVGHSDADVGLHTLTDAIYGALARGDIGTHFPPSDAQWKGAESHIFLTHAVEMAAEMGFTLTHADLTFLCERPKIGPHVSAMRTRLAELLRIEAARISVKATTTERLGFTGREEGIAAMATITLVKI